MNLEYGMLESWEQDDFVRIRNKISKDYLTQEARIAGKAGAAAVVLGAGAVAAPVAFVAWRYGPFKSRVAMHELESFLRQACWRHECREVDYEAFPRIPVLVKQRLKDNIWPEHHWIWDVD